MTQDHGSILLIRMTSLGDIILTLPAIRAIRQHFSLHHVTMLTSLEYIDLVSEIPYLDEIITFDRRGRELTETIRVVRRLRKRKFDLVIDLHGKFRTRLLSKLSGGRQRIGSRRDAYPPNTHTIDDHFQLLSTIGIQANDRSLEFYVTTANQCFAHELLSEKLLLDGQLKIGIFPGAAWDYKCWPADRFAEVADRMRKQYNAAILLFGGPAEAELVNQVRDSMQTDPILFGTNLQLGQLAALISCCDQFVSNDTGPTHIAVALGVPTIVLFGITNHLKFGPLDPIHTVIRYDDSFDRSKGSDIMRLITVDEVWGIAEEKLNALDKKKHQ